MLRKRTRSSHPKDQRMNNLTPDAISEAYFHSDIMSQKHKDNSFLKVTGLFVGFNPRSSDSDSVRSPTSPLDFRIFSNFGNPFRCPKSQNEGCHKSWGCSKVGLSIIDSLENETKQPGKVTRLSDNKNILFGRQMSVRSPNFCSHVSPVEATPKSLPKNVAVCPSTCNNKTVNIQKGNSDVVFEIGEGTSEPKLHENLRACSLDSGRSGSHLINFGNRKSRLGSGNLVLQDKMMKVPSGSAFVEEGLKLGTSYSSITVSELELSEDYTCVTTHGQNPKVTHILGDCILECHIDEKKVGDLLKKCNEGVDNDILASYPCYDFLKFCYSCNKKLDGEDIYMYRGEKAFCSYSCRSHEIEIDEEMEKTDNSDPSEISDSCKEIYNSSLFIATT